MVKSGDYQNKIYFLNKQDILPIACLLGQTRNRILDQEEIVGSCDLIHESYFLFEQSLCFIVLFMNFWSICGK